MQLEINSEAQAWDALEGLLNGDIVLDSIDNLIIGDWVKTTILIPGQRYDSALNAYMMQGWQDVQRAIYRSFALISKGSADARALTDIEKDRLELIVKIKSGSSDQEAALVEILTEAALGAVDKMEPNHIVIVLVVMILTWGGVSTMRTWLNNRKEEKLAELSEGTNKQAFETMGKAFTTIQALATDANRNQLIQNAAQKIPLVEELGKEADIAKQSLVKHASQFDATVNGVFLTAEAAQKITREIRTSIAEERKDGVYKIQKVDTTVPDGFNVHVENVISGETFSANVQEVISSLNDRSVIQKAEWTKVPVELQINAKLRKGKIVEALILRATQISTPEN